MTSKSKPVSKMTRQDVEKIIQKHPDRLPIIVREDKKNTSKWQNFLVPSQLTIGDFMVILRRKIKLEAYESIYIFIQPNQEVSKTKLIMPPTSSTIGQIYHDHHDDKLLLKLIWARENTFG